MKHGDLVRVTCNDGSKVLGYVRKVGRSGVYVWAQPGIGQAEQLWHVASDRLELVQAL